MIVESMKCTHCGATNPGDAKYCSKCGYALPVLPAPAAIDTEPKKKKELTKEERKKRIFGVVFAVVGGTIGSLIAQRAFMHPSYDKALMEAASEINKSCPIMVDAETRMDNSTAMSGMTLQYNYTLVHFNAADVDTGRLQQLTAPAIINNIRTSPDMKSMRDHKVTFIYNYRDKTGAYMYRLAVPPESYQ